MKEKIKVGVFLGTLSYSIKEWEEKWLNDEVNDSYPYGYDRANKDEVDLEYISLNKIEQFFCKNKIILNLYLYFIKLPIVLPKYDIVWTHYDKDSLHIAKLKKIPIIGNIYPKHIGCFVWLIDKSKYYSKTKIRYISKLLNNIDRIIYLAHTEGEIFHNKFNIPKNRLNYVRFGINMNSYSDKSNMIKPEFMKDIDEYIFSVGGDIHRNFDLLINVAEDMKDKNFIIGTQNILKCGLKNVKVKTLNLKEMRYMYNNSLFVVVPLKYNEHASGCTTILESAAMKKAVIVSDVPGIRDYVLDGKTGIVVPIGDKEKLKKAILYLSENPIIAQKMGENGFEYIKDKFTTDTWANKHLYISKEILSRE